ncbi:MAG: hypothetical protein MI747_08020 [Desulfobacterales bacterium]|nr:hypothetical protein [Desulfobacterales bacterium]
MKKLLDPGRIGTLTLKNRVVALPVFTGYALPDGRVSPLMLAHYRRLARSGAAMVVVPNVAIHGDGRTSERSLILDSAAQVGELAKLARVIRDNGSLACLQLNHGGRYAICDTPMLPSAMSSGEAFHNVPTLKNFMESFPFIDRFALTAHLAKMTAGWTHEMDESDISMVISQYARAARRAVDAGFDAVELHGATGYLLAQFLSGLTNRRKSPWGGDARARMAFPLAVVEAVKQAIPEAMPLGYRLILDEKVEGGVTTERAFEFSHALSQAGIDYFSATVGSYQSMFTPKVVKSLSRPGYLGSLCHDLRQRTKVPVIISGRIISPQLAEKTLAKEEADFIGLGRPLLADPQWLVKGVNKEKIVGCKNCNTCFRHVALGESVICDRWPKVVQDRIRLETRFTSRNGYRTLIVSDSLSDLKLLRMQAEKRAPIHQGILDRQLFLNVKKEPGFMEAARDYAKWAEGFYQKKLGRGRIENVFVEDVDDPGDIVLDHVKEDFGFVCFFHNGEEDWKRGAALRLPGHVVVFRGGAHPRVQRVLVPCDLSPYTLMQIRVARHLWHGRGDSTFSFVHVGTPSPGLDREWREIMEELELDPDTPLKLIGNSGGASVADALIREVREGDFGSLVIGRQGGLSKVRRRFFGSVSDALMRQLPECTFGVVG